MMNEGGVFKLSLSASFFSFVMENYVKDVAVRGRLNALIRFCEMRQRPWAANEVAGAFG